MTTISKLAYQIVADTQQFTQGVTLTRNELALTRQVMRDSITPAQAYAAEIAALDQVLAKGAITQEQYAAAVDHQRQIHGQLTDDQRSAQAAAEQQQAASQRQAEAMQRGAQVTQQFQTKQEQLAVQQRELTDLLAQGAITQETYNRAAAQVNLERVQESAGNVRNIAIGIAATSAAVTAGLVAMGNELVNTWSIQEDAEIKLAAIMDVNATNIDGRYVQ